MAEVNPPLFLDSDNAYGADELGLPYRDLIGEGVVASGDLAVSQRAAGANMSVDVAAGEAWIAGDADEQPTYRARNDATVNRSVTAADAALPRIDLVVAEVLDAAFSGSSKLWQIRVVPGTPAASPAAPATPANSVVLAELAIAAAATSVQTANITDRRKRAIVGLGQASGQRGARIRRTANLSVPTSFASEIAVTWQAERYDHGGYWDAAAATRLTCPADAAGLHRIAACIEWDVNATGARRLRLRLNGTTIIAVEQDSAATANNHVQSIATEYDLAAGDYVELLAAHGAGVALLINATANYSPEATISRV